MQVEVLVVPDCPNEKTAVAKLQQVLNEAGIDETAITTHIVTDQHEAEQIGFTGSPTIRINGQDPFAVPGRAPGLTCRVYRTNEGISGTPDIHQLR